MIMIDTIEKHPSFHVISIDTTPSSFSSTFAIIYMGGSGHYDSLWRHKTLHTPAIGHSKEGNISNRGIHKADIQVLLLRKRETLRVSTIRSF